MLLRRIGLENFKRFKKLERDFASGINVVKGPVNEIGKSTLIDGIMVALFDNPRSSSRELEKYTRWGSERRCRTVIEFEAGGEKYLLEKDFDAKILRLTGPDTDREWNTPNEVAEKLRELLGTASSTLFLATSCIRQDQVRNISSGKKEIGEILEGIITGGVGEEAASRVIERLDKEIISLTRGMQRASRSLGPIARLTQQVAALNIELAEVTTEVDGAERQKIEMSRVSHELNRVEEKLGEVGALLEKNIRRLGIEEGIDKLEKEHEEIDTLNRDVEDLHKKLQEANIELQTTDGFDDTQKTLELADRLRELEAERRNISSDIPGRKRELEIIEEQFRKNRLLAGVGSMATLVIGAVISVAGFVGAVFHLASLVIGIMGLVLLVGVMWARSRLAQRKTQLVSLQERIEQMEKALMQVAGREGEIASQANCQSVEDFWQKNKRYGELSKQKDSHQNQLLGRLGGRTLEQIEQNMRNILRMLAEEREKLTDDLISTRLSPEEYVKLEREVENLKDQKDQLERSYRDCELSIGRARFDAEDQAQKEERLDALRDNLQREQRRFQIYQLTREFVSRARDNTLQPATAYLQTEIQKNFDVFTDGKYKRVKVGQEPLDFRIYSDEKDDWVIPDDLSGGAIDEFYLACRLALVHLMYGDTRPPLILDDPFVNFDRPRLARTLQFLVQLSQEHQVIIFTLGDSYDQIAEKVIELA